MGISPVNTNFYVNNNIGSTFDAFKNKHKIPFQSEMSDTNLIFLYLKNQGQNNINPNFTKVYLTPSQIEDFDNYSEVDKFGNEITTIKHSMDGTSLVQQIKTKSPDGTVLEKTVKNSDNFKSAHIVISDKNNRTLMIKDKSYIKQDENNAQTIVNGEVYNISGLNGDVITVEHNNQKIQLDLNKMLVPEVKLLELNTSPDNYLIREHKITNEEKEKLFNRIKSLSGDDLFRLSKCTEHIQFLDNTKLDAHFVDAGKTLLLSGKDWENSSLITNHELGHAINHLNTPDIISNNNLFAGVRNYEKLNFQKYGNLKDTDNAFNEKFITGNPDLNWNNTDNENITDEDCLRDETFAESYNLLNTLDIIHYDDERMPSRMLSMCKYMPKTLVEVEKLSKI